MAGQLLLLRGWAVTGLLAEVLQVKEAKSSVCQAWDTLKLCSGRRGASEDRASPFQPLVARQQAGFGQSLTPGWKAEVLGAGRVQGDSQ
jgi:hypothetical protein